ncbi:hypothetical protein O6H91_10G024000 [Diphasiastrum complanatum]|uniref:Uncharacterized protein n=1 Tax=Diphasiastrum complanatum TaxID=34168 RepID=A0ACC2CFI1_DIPCM|nr:hypothetical protein O6H91_10G024000 [Diphasiastrum complanatum]
MYLNSHAEKVKPPTMPAPWLSWTKSLACKSDKEQIHEPKCLIPQPKASLHQSGLHHSRLLQGRAAHRSSCSWRLSGLKDVVQGNTKVVHKSTSESPLSRDSLASIDQEFIPDALLADSNEEFRFATLSSLSSLKPGTPRPPTPSFASMKPTPLRKLAGCNRFSVNSETMESTILCKDTNCGPGSQSRLPRTACSKGGRCHSKREAAVNHIVRRAVTELSAGDSSRNIVEIIFRTSWLKKESPLYRIERILKVHNTQRTLSRFEEYRDMVKSKANNMIKKHARCIADGNELLRFYGCTIECSLGSYGSTSLCTISSCMICRIIRSGFFSNNSGAYEAIQTAATSGKAHLSITREDEDYPGQVVRHAMLVCRVIAGRMHKGSAGNMEELGLPDGYDSFAGEVGRHSNVEKLCVFNPRAVLPCFVVIYTC